jgi:hypothetical protein
MRTYNLNAEQAKQADNVGMRITETGKYRGIFTRAEAIRSKQDTEGVEFAFKSTTGQEADFLTLWTHDATGKEVYGLKLLNALMTCLKVKTITPTVGQVEKWDGAARNKVAGNHLPRAHGQAHRPAAAARGIRKERTAATGLQIQYLRLFRG